MGREKKLAEILKDRLNQYVQGKKEDFVNHVKKLKYLGSLMYVIYLVLEELCIGVKEKRKSLFILLYILLLVNIFFIFPLVLI